MYFLLFYQSNVNLSTLKSNSSFANFQFLISNFVKHLELHCLSAMKVLVLSRVVLIVA